MKKIITIAAIWIISILLSVIWTFENTDVIGSFKAKLKEKQGAPKTNFDSKESNEEIIVVSNSFNVKAKKVISLKGKTTFLLNNSNSGKFDAEDITIFTQNGFKLQKEKKEKLNINKNFTLEFNGGIKTIFFIEKKIYGLVSSVEKDCYYASIVDFENSKEVFKTNCLLKEVNSAIDFNGLGSSFVRLDENIIFSIGTPTQDSTQINSLAQDKKSYFGKILNIDLKNIKKDSIQPSIFSLGHRNPQGLTKTKKYIFSVEHGPKGGDELNKIQFGENYGWPLVSYGTKYFFHDNGKSYRNNHEENGFKEPLYALTPSVGISAVNNCPKKLIQFYKKNCLLALSLYGNELRQGKSLIIFLLDKNFEKIHSIEKIFLNDKLVMRHFMTNDKNEIYEDANGNIYVSADNEGIYQISFQDFR
tara:strand:+ start:244 stop:1494 length:1251 start_codon:yes stop_codon:yes gene_type:complete